MSAPLLLTALVVGLVVSIFQAATQINEATLSFIPKLLAMFAALILAGPWTDRFNSNWGQSSTMGSGCSRAFRR